MPTHPTKPEQDPAEGSRETIDRELARTEDRRKQTTPRDPEPAPGDEAAPGTPGTGEDICPECRGTGRLAAKPCPNCNGTGTVISGIGGA